MKKEIIIITILAVLTVLLSCLKIYKNNETQSDNIKFKEEYESLNDTYNEKTGKNYMSISIDEDNKIEYVDGEEVIDILENKTGVIYFGFPECPWCRNAVPVLIDAANELQIDKIYYYNALEIRDEKQLDDDGNVVTTKEGTKEYQKIIELLKDYLPAYAGLNDDTIKRLYFPTVVFVKDGKVLGLHSSTVDSQEDPYVQLNQEQVEELKQIYIDGMNQVYEILCDQAC
jgi:thiol-disulfide isomerase/thioredoxin